MEQSFQSTQIKVCLSNTNTNQMNKIKTNKYTWYSFLPMNLLEQFTKLANFYFLILAILQTVPQISITEGTPTMFIPLCFILVVTASKDLYEDYKHKQSDEQENEKLTRIEDKQVQWQNLSVGNIIKIMNNEDIPADILLLGTSEKQGICYVETKGLDGETNLKQKQVPKDLQTFYSNEDFHQKNITLEYDWPNQQLYNFHGTYYYGEKQYQLLKEKEEANNTLHKMRLLRRLTHQQSQLRICQNAEALLTQQQESPKFPIDIKNILLRGSSLRNTQYVYGVIIYAGHDTKIMLNSIKSKYKASRLEHTLNRQILLIFIIQMCICFFAALYYSIWFQQNQNELPYLEIHKNAKEDKQFTYNLFARLGNWVLMFGQFLIIFMISNMVPISLLVTLETVKFVQALILQKDKHLQYQSIMCEVQTSNLNEELGQVSYIFSDKTGTLTQNKMVFKNICISGTPYGDYTSDRYESIDGVDFSDPHLLVDLQGRKQKEIFLVLILLGLCHTAVIETVEGQIRYNVSSPDEYALLQFIRLFGLEYRGINDKNIITINANNVDLHYQFYFTLEFDSNRKRSSIIVKDLQENEIYLLSKGADNVMMSRASSANQLDKLNVYHQYIHEYSRRGLRILVLGVKVLKESDFLEWKVKYESATTIMRNRIEKMQQLQDEIEQDLEIVGITAIEDKLQDNVESCIQSFRDAGIKIWMLTGDKIETARNIAFSCKLLNEFMTPIIELSDKLTKEDIKSELKPCQGLIVAGEALSLIVKDKQLENIFMVIAKECKTVLCCRVSPSQKESIVRLSKQYYEDAVTLAIGDGANDVSMITSAHVGIGIKGLEGQQAARASDYSIGEFQKLKYLLFVFGRECYRRNANLVLYNFYKNILLVLPQFWQIINNIIIGFQYLITLVDKEYMMTSFIKCIIYFIHPCRLQYMLFLIMNNLNNYYQKMKEIFIKLDYLVFYFNIILDQRFNNKLFWLWFVEAFYQSAIITFFTIYIVDVNNIDGAGFSLWISGTLIFGLAIITSNLKIIIISNGWSIAHVFFFFGMFIMYIITLAIFEQTPQHDGIFYILPKVFFKWIIHLNNILVIGATTLIDYANSKIESKFVFRQKIQTIPSSTELI